MTQAKKSKKAVENQPSMQLLQQFRNFPVNEQQAISHFFNLHNAAVFLFQSLSSDAQAYVNMCVEFSEHGQQIEAEEQKSDKALKAVVEEAGKNL